MKEPAKYPRIRQLRKEFHLIQEDLAIFLHISRRSYSYYETGDLNVPVETLCALADFYGVSMDYLVGRTDCRKPETQSDHAFLTANTPAMIVSERRAFLRAQKKAAKQ